MGLEFYCRGKTNKQPQLEMFWWDDNSEWFTPKNSIKGRADNGVVVVDLSSSEAWRTSTSIRAIRVDLANYDSCEAIKLDGIFYGI